MSLSLRWWPMLRFGKYRSRNSLFHRRDIFKMDFIESHPFVKNWNPQKVASDSGVAQEQGGDTRATSYLTPSRRLSVLQSLTAFSKKFRLRNNETICPGSKIPKHPTGKWHKLLDPGNHVTRKWSQREEMGCSEEGKSLAHDLLLLQGVETSMMMIELHSSWFEKCDRPRANCSYTLSLEISSCNLKCLIRIQNLEHEERFEI